MARKPARKKTRTTKKNYTPLPGWVWMLTGLGIGLSATFLPNLNQQKSSDKSTVTQTSEPTETSKRTFDFYTLLPELEVVVDEHQSSSTSPKQTKNTNSENFVLQVGSFKSADEADTLKAQLALMGVETNIQVVQVNSTHWHRVRVGPSKNLSQLQSIQKRLRSNKMDTILLKVKS